MKRLGKRIGISNGVSIPRKTHKDPHPIGKEVGNTGLLKEKQSLKESISFLDRGFRYGI
jgi:hypothetical protein